MLQGQAEEKIERRRRGRDSHEYMTERYGEREKAESVTNEQGWNSPDSKFPISIINARGLLPLRGGFPKIRGIQYQSS